MPPSLSEEVESARANPARAFGPFLLLSELGKGGMGVVYRAWNDRLRRVVALKTILPGADVRGDALERFRREAEAVARLRHPCIVAVHEAGEVAGRHYIAMDFVPGATLAQRLVGRERIPLTKALEALRDVARAVHHAHTQGVIHRDLKPQNIIIDESGRPHVLDFGLARVRELGDTKLTKTGTVLGTPAYMPPEQAGGTGDRVDERSDVYSLGATLYHVLTGRPPFEGQIDLNVITAVLLKDPVPPSKLNSRARGDLETICLKCLEKEPGRRYASAEALADELDRHLAGAPIEARPLGRAGRAYRWARRNRLLASALAVAVATSFGAVAFVATDRVARDRAGKLAANEEAARQLAEFEAVRKKTKGDEVLAKGLDAFQAALNVLSRDPSEQARERACSIARSLGNEALAAEQWSVAAHAFARAGQISGDEARRKRDLDAVEARRTRVAHDHFVAVSDVFSKLRAGRLGEVGGKEGALMELVRYPEAQTVAVIASELDAVSLELESSARELYASSRIPGIEQALAKRAGLKPGTELDNESRIVLSAAENVLETNERNERAKALTRARRFREIVGDFQGGRLGPSKLAIEELASKALGWIGIAEGAVEPLGRVLRAEEDDRRAIAPGEALSRIAGRDQRAAPRVLELLWSALDHFDTISVFGETVRPLYTAIRDPDSDRALGTATELYKRAIRRGVRGDVRGAIADLDRSIALDPRNGQAFAERGRRRLEDGDPSGALADEKRAVDLDPGNARIFIASGIVREAAGDLAGAAADYDRAVELDPGNVMALSSRGNLERKRGRFAEAIADFDRALALDGRNVEVLYGRGLAREQKGDLDGATTDFDTAIEINPKRELCFYWRGIVRGFKGDVQGAIADFSRTIELNPRNVSAYMNRGVALYMKGDLRGAIADYDRTIELDPKDAGAFLRRGNAKFDARDRQGAIADYERCLELDPRAKEAGNVRKRLEELERGG